MAIAKTGKIASSTGNYGSTGNALDKSNANGFVDHNWDVITNSTTQLFAPNLNLGVSLRDTVVPTVAGYTNYTNGPGLGYGTLGYQYTFTEDSITIVTPDAIPTNPNLGSHAGLSFNRYEASLPDFMRGAQSCIVIGSDLFTPNNYVNGGFNSPGYQYMTFGQYQTFIGKNNFKGLGSSEIYGGYVMEISGNTLIGSNNFNAMVDQNGTFINTYISEGNNGYGPITEAFSNIVLGSDNVCNSLTKRPNGYGASIRGNVIVGRQNASLRPQVGGLRQFRTNSSEQYFQNFSNTYRVMKQSGFSNNTIFGSNNLIFPANNENGFDGTYNDYPYTSMSNNFVFGSGIGYNRTSNWFAAGSGDQSGFANQNDINNNLLMGTRINFNKKNKSEIALGYSLAKNIILEGIWEVVQDELTSLQV